GQVIAPVDAGDRVEGGVGQVDALGREAVDVLHVRDDEAGLAGVAQQRGEDRGGDTVGVEGQQRVPARRRVPVGGGADLFGRQARVRVQAESDQAVGLGRQRRQ